MKKTIPMGNIFLSRLLWHYILSYIVFSFYPSFLSISWLQLLFPIRNAPKALSLFLTFLLVHSPSFSLLPRLFNTRAYFFSLWMYHFSLKPKCSMSKILLLWSTITKILSLLSSLVYQYYQILLQMLPPNSFNLSHLEKTARPLAGCSNMSGVTCL